MNADNYSEYFNSRMPSKFAMPILNFWHCRMFTIAKKYISDFNKKTICEIGPGHGFIGNICLKNKMHYCGYEQNEEQAETLRQKGYNVIVANVPPLPAGEPVQVIWISHVLEHMPSAQEAKQLMLSCYDRLDPKGYVVIIGPDILHWKAEFWNSDWSHSYPTSVNIVEQLLSDAGFSVEHSMHHACTLANPFFASVISYFFRLFPMSMIDFVFYKLYKRKLFHSFMTLFGLRQIYVIGKKNDDKTTL